MAVILTPGQAGDNPQLEPLLDLHHQQYPLPHKPRFRLLADKAYSHPSTREKLRRRRIPHTIPERQDQQDRRKAKGSKGGRPPGFDQQTYANCTWAGTTGPADMLDAKLPSSVLIVSDAPDSYAITATSKSTNTFKITKASGSSTVARTCDTPNKGACPSDGQW